MSIFVRSPFNIDRYLFLFNSLPTLTMTDVPFTLDQLRILKAIAAEGSFKRAADRLYVSQPAISLQVQNLERQLNVPLFDSLN